MTPQNDQVSYYEILQLTPQATDDDVKRAYRRLALHHHPDKHPHNKHVAELRFRLITKAYNELKTVESRRRYNHIRDEPVPGSNNDNSHAPLHGWMKPFADLFRPARKQV